MKLKLKNGDLVHLYKITTTQLGRLLLLKRSDIANISKYILCDQPSKARTLFISKLYHEFIKRLSSKLSRAVDCLEGSDYYEEIIFTTSINLQRLQTLCSNKDLMRLKITSCPSLDDLTTIRLFMEHLCSLPDRAEFKKERSFIKKCKQALEDETISADLLRFMLSYNGEYRIKGGDLIYKAFHAPIFRATQST